VRVSQFEWKTPPKGEGNVSVASPRGSATVLYVDGVKDEVVFKYSVDDTSPH